MADRNIYLDNDGVGDGSIGNPYGAFSEINWTTGGANSIYDWVDGGDDVYINLKKGVTWRETLTIGTDGVNGHPITIQAYDDGDDPIISTADVITSWTIQSQEVGYAVYRGGPGGSDAEYFFALDDGATERNPYHQTVATTWANYTIDRQFCGSAGTSYYYIRTDGTAQDPGSVEIGIRSFAINLVDRDYITINGITCLGPNGVPTGGSSDFKNFGLISITGASTNIIIDDVTMRYATTGIRLVGASVTDITIQNSLIEKCWSGIYVHQGNFDADRNILIQDCEIGHIAEAYNEAIGDRACIGSQLTRGLRIRRCYIHDQGSANLAGTEIDPAINFSGANDAEVSWCLIKNVARSCIAAANEGAEDLGNILFAYNVGDNWAAFPTGAVAENHSGIRIGGASTGVNFDDMWIIGNTLTNAGDPGAGSNHYTIYFTSASQTEIGTFTISNNIANNNDNMDYEFFIAGGAYTDFAINNNCFYQDGDSVSGWGTAQTVAELNALHANFDSNIATDPDLDANYHLGASSTCDNAGDDLGATYDDGLDEDTTWSPLSVVTADQDSYGAGWDIGAFIEGTAAPAGWTGTVGGVVNPSKVMGVGVGDINEIMGF